METLNHRTMTIKVKELADMMARSISGGLKVFYHGVNKKRNGVEAILDTSVEVKRESDRITGLKLEIK